MMREKFLKIFSLHSDDRHYAFFIKNEMCGNENQKNSWVCEKKKPKANFIKMTIAFRFGEKQTFLLYCESVRSFLVRDVVFYKILCGGIGYVVD